MTPSYIPMPDGVELDPEERALVRGLIASIANLYDRLEDGLRLEVTLDLDELRRRTAMSDEAIADARERLGARGLLLWHRRGSRPTRYAVSPALYGYPEDDMARRRAGRQPRVYVPFPRRLLGEFAPAPTAVFEALVSGLGSWIYQRIERGEHLVIFTTAGTLAELAGVSQRTAERALAELEAAGILTRRTRGRAGTAITIRPDGAFGAQPNPAREIPPEAGVTAENPATGRNHPPAHHDLPKRGTGSNTARTRADVTVPWRELRSIRSALEHVCLADPRRSSPGLTRRIERAALALASTGVSAELVGHWAIAYQRRRGERPTPERFIDEMPASELQTAVGNEPCVAEIDPFDDGERAVLAARETWERLAELGAPIASEQLREFGGRWPWAVGYVPRSQRCDTPTSPAEMRAALDDRPVRLVEPTPVEPERRPGSADVYEGIRLLRARLAELRADAS